MITEPARRSALARVGIALLNLPQPGLGLVRIGAGRAGAIMIALPLLWIIAWIAIFVVAPAPSFIGVIVFAGIAIGFVVVVDVLAIVMTWRRSVMMPVSP